MYHMYQILYVNSPMCNCTHNRTNKISGILYLDIGEGIPGLFLCGIVTMASRRTATISN